MCLLISLRRVNICCMEMENLFGLTSHWISLYLAMQQRALIVSILLLMHLPWHICGNMQCPESKYFYMELFVGFTIAMIKCYAKIIIDSTGGRWIWKEFLIILKSSVSQPFFPPPYPLIKPFCHDDNITTFLIYSKFMILGILILIFKFLFCLVFKFL